MKKRVQEGFGRLLRPRVAPFGEVELVVSCGENRCEGREPVKHDERFSGCVVSLGIGDFGIVLLS